MIPNWPNLHFVYSAPSSIFIANLISLSLHFRKPPRAQSGCMTNGISSSCDGLNLSLQTRDSGVHSPDEQSFMSAALNATGKR